MKSFASFEIDFQSFEIQEMKKVCGREEGVREEKEKERTQKK
jgi:hypothetical protein